jgi:hypothetical protein
MTQQRTPNCCDLQGHNCDQGRSCPSAQAKRCHTLGVCQGLGAKHCSACPPQPTSAAPAAPAMPSHAAPQFPFAPGVIQGPDMPIQFLDKDKLPWFSPLELLLMVFLLFVLAGLGGLLAGVLA